MPAEDEFRKLPNEKYELIPNRGIIGHGAFALVFMGREKATNTNVAIKAIDKKNMAKQHDRSKKKALLEKEIGILKKLSSLKHENLVALLHCVESDSYVFLVMEYCNGGDLSEYLAHHNRLNEATIRHFFSQIALAMKAIHDNKIVHRDLKPQNILLCKPAQGGNNPLNYVVKLADFGFARFLADGVMTATLCGSPMYMAPEVIMSCHYNSKADLWSIGTIIYQCLVSQAPFVAKTPQALKQFYIDNKTLSPNIPATCSDSLRDLLLRLLKHNPMDRIEFCDFFNHPFLTKPLPSPSPSRRIDTQTNFYASSPRMGGAVLPSSAQTNRVYETMARPSPFRSNAVDPMRSSPRPTSLSRNLPSSHARSPARPFPASTRADVAAAPSKVASPPKAAMGDSNDFTFWPPLDPSKQQHIQYSNGTVQNNDNPVKQVRVHSNTPPVRSQPVPVPSQRTNFTKISERQQHSKSPVTPGNRVAESGTQMPCIENISVPETTFIVNEHPPNASNSAVYSRVRRFTTNDLTTCADEEEKTGKFSTPAHSEHHGQTSIPKSATSAGPLSDSNKGNAKLPPPVDNIQYLSTSPTHTSASATVKIISPTSSSKPSTAAFPTFYSDEEDEGENDQMAFTGNAANLESSSSQLMESVSGNETGTTTSSGVYSAAVAKAKSQNDLNGGKSPMGDGNALPSFGMDAPVDLDPETLLEREHHKILNKLQFISEFIETLVNVADNISNPIGQIVTGIRQMNSDNNEVYHRSEQIVLYVRAMYILTSALHFSEQQIANRTLHASNKVKHVLNQLNDKYHYCLTRSQELASLGISGGSPTTSVVSAEKIMYRHALDLCQSAALYELFGTPEHCPKRYQTAYMMLHMLSEQVQNEQDRSILARYKSAVEKRLRILEGKGYVTAVANN